ncbi:hypothetical protein MN116_000721 [Schistosoma mekongi]|uniref:Indoleamine 2,3-dioxygenase n=1 Tax=Schistosoma mekongi TaxID=38744 RepID=A0AAE1ZJ16_SCHME|nr:hypothetical protein MN116_000721 [Schistosoma mekongi]
MNNLKFYCLSDKTGAILENPLKALPSKWKAWNSIIDQLPELSRNRTVRNEVDLLPLLDLDGLNSHEELRLAHKILAFLSSVYVWQDGEGGETESIPVQIAKPLLCVSKLLGIQPILTHTDLVLCNCIPSTSTKEENYLSFLQSIHLPTYHPSWKAFITLSGECEVYFAPILQEIIKAIKAQDPLNEDIIIKCLENIDELFIPFRKSLKNFYEDEEFFKEMQTYMITEHRQFLDDLAMYSRIRSIAVESKSTNLKSNYNQCLQSLWNFRNSHISLVNKFIIEPSKKTEAKIKQLEITGTSGQCLNVFLQRVRDASSSAILK